MKLDISLATIEDLPKLHQLDELCFETDKLTYNQYKTFQKQPDTAVIVVKQRQDVVGSAILVLKKKKHSARLYSIAVDPSKRRLGIAKALYEFIENYALANHCQSMELEVRQDNEAAILFYKKKGFVVISEFKKYYDDGMGAFRMRKTL